MVSIFFVIFLLSSAGGDKGVESRELWADFNNWLFYFPALPSVILQSLFQESCWFDWRPTEHNSNSILHTVCVVSFDQQNTTPISTCAVSVLRPLTTTTQLQFQLAQCQCYALWPLQHNSNFNLHNVRVTPFDHYNTTPISTCTLSVLHPLTTTTQFQLQLTQWLSCSVYPQPEFNTFVSLHLVLCSYEFYQTYRKFVCWNCACCVYHLIVSVFKPFICNLPLFEESWESSFLCL